MQEFLGGLIPATPYEDESKEFLVSKCHELENKWLSEQKTAMELAYEIEQQNSQLSELKRQNAELARDAERYRKARTMGIAKQGRWGLGIV